MKCMFNWTQQVNDLAVNNFADFGFEKKLFFEKVLKNSFCLLLAVCFGSLSYCHPKTLDAFV
uniref:Uncharacterized protein n=1 Tax=Anguilla anguilla TaxID=7936 RepID=A0A0E9TTM6_ANGAN